MKFSIGNGKMKLTRGSSQGLLVLLIVLLSGCNSIGPTTIERDRFDYVSAISDSWKRQTLLNLVKTRYVDVPVFLDIASVINQYSMESELRLGIEGEFYNRSDPSYVGPSIGATGRYTDRPTITYTPLMGQNFARSLMRRGLVLLHARGARRVMVETGDQEAANALYDGIGFTEAYRGRGFVADVG